ncbi:MAG: murein L,D-transpeptidase YafK [Paracoccaceae bacterium]|jgi:murein L,D-transpeptidase YafK
MILNRRALLLSALSLGACSQSKFKSYEGPQVTRVVVLKGSRKMYLLNGNSALRTYDFDLGFAPVGHKQIEGDGRTPEGSYLIDRRNPNSSFHLSIGIDYPNARDIAVAEAMGKSPGGEIFIHGQPTLGSANGPDWTAGCIAVENPEIEEIYAMVQNGTQIDLFA